MNEVIKELFSRKSVRIYLEKEIEKEEKNLIISSAFQAPTAGNMQLYSIIDVTKEEVKEKLSVLCDNQAFIKQAPMVLVFLADANKWYKAYEEFLDIKANESLADYFLGFSDALIAAQNTVVAAESLGIGSCYIGDIVENYEHVKELLKLPKGVYPVAMLTFGYPVASKTFRLKPERFPADSIVFENEYKEIDIKSAFIEKIRKNKDLTDEEALQKALTYVKSVYKNKTNSLFFEEMNRSLKEMLKEYFK